LHDQWLRSLIFNNSFGWYKITEVEAVLKPMDQCGRKDIFLGGCGSNGSKTCINDFVKKGGVAAKPSSCECDDFGEEHLCRCYVPC